MALDVSERIRAHFRPSTNHGIERWLPESYAGQSIDLSVTSVTDGSGERIPWTSRSEGDRVVLRIGDPDAFVSGDQDYVITYTIGRAMTSAPDGTEELYLDVNGVGWLQRIDRVSASLTVADTLVGRLTGQSACYYGPAGATQRCTVASPRPGFLQASVDSLGGRETMTLAVGFTPGTVAAPIPQPRASTLGWVGVLATPAAGLLGLGGVLLLRAWRRRTSAGGRPIVTQYSPPDGIPAIVAADLLNRPERGAAAQLAELAVTGLARLNSDAAASGEGRRRGLLARRRARDLRTGITVTLSDGIRDLEPNELSRVCGLLFGDGRTVDLGDAASSDDIDVASTLRRKLMATMGLRTKSDGAFHLLAIGMLTLVLIGWIVVWLGLGGLHWAFLPAGLVGCVLLVAAVYLYPSLAGLTDRGRRVVDHLLGLREFVTMAEADRIAWLQNLEDAPRLASEQNRLALYEPLLPYAIIFGAEKTWQQVLGSLLTSGAATPALVSGTPHLLDLDWFDSEGPLRHTYARTNDSRLRDSRPAFGDGRLATTISAGFDSWSSRGTGDDGEGGGGWSSDWWRSSPSTRRSRSSDSPRNSSGGGGSSGGGLGGGGGGGW